MAHLVNAKSFRLGWNSSWSDLWYAYEYNYASFLFICCRIRAFLKQLFFDPKIDKTKFYIFSHFVVFKAIRYITIKIHFYFIPFIQIFNKIFFNRIPVFYRWVSIKLKLLKKKKILALRKKLKRLRKKYKEKFDVFHGKKTWKKKKKKKKTI